MMFVYNIVNSLGLHVKLQMTLLADNAGAVCIEYNWSIGACPRHMDVKQNYLNELKERSYLHVKNKKGMEIIPDIRTKHLGVSDYWRITNTFMS